MFLEELTVVKSAPATALVTSSTSDSSKTVPVPAPTHPPNNTRRHASSSLLLRLALGSACLASSSTPPGWARPVPSAGLATTIFGPSPSRCGLDRGLPRPHHGPLRRLSFSMPSWQAHRDSVSFPHPAGTALYSSRGLSGMDCVLQQQVFQAWIVTCRPTSRP